MKTVSFELALQAFMIFEGLSLWKIEPFAARSYQGSLVGYKETKQCIWDNFKKESTFPVWKCILFLVYVFFLCPLEGITRRLLPLFKITPYIWGLVFPFVILIYAVWPDCVSLPDDLNRKAAKVFLVFITLKFLLYLLYLVFKKIRNYLLLEAPLPQKETASFFALKKDS